MSQQVAISRITVTRDLDPQDDLAPLMDHISRNGLQVPILLVDLNLVDGLRRLEAVKKLGYETIEAVTAQVPGEACDNIQQALTPGVLAQELTYNRIWEIYRDLKPLIFSAKSIHQRGRPVHSRWKDENGGLRARLARTLGLRPPSLMNAINQIFGTAENDPTEYGDIARECRDLINAGQLSFWSAVGRLDRYQKAQRASGMGPAAQEQVLHGVVSALQGVGHAIKSIGVLSPQTDPTARSEALKELMKLRTTLTTFINQLHRLEKGTTKK